MSHDKSAHFNRNVPEATVSTPWPPSYTHCGAHCNSCSCIAGVAPHSSSVFVWFLTAIQNFQREKYCRISEGLLGQRLLRVGFTCALYPWHRTWCYLDFRSISLTYDLVLTWAIYPWHRTWCYLDLRSISLTYDLVLTSAIYPWLMIWCYLDLRSISLKLVLCWLAPYAPVIGVILTFAVYSWYNELVLSWLAQYIPDIMT
jgi:hypothetical protein